MINNQHKTALLFGVRNDSSLAWPVALRLLESGCQVLLSVDPSNAEAVRKMTHGTPMTVYEADVRKDSDLEQLRETLSQSEVVVEYLLHAVAFGNHRVMCSTPPGVKEPPPDFIDIPLDDFVDSFNISAFSLLRISKVFRSLLAPEASILTFTYQASQQVFPGYAGMAINKAALENIVKYLAWYFGGAGVRVNAISAGLVMTTSAGGIAGVRKLRKIGKHTAPLSNVTADDVADAALYYFSSLSQKVTGNIHYVDGGFNIMGVAALGDE